MCIRDSIEPSTGFIIRDCYTDEAGDGSSAFCSRITRDLASPENPQITFMDLGFINRDQEIARGVDYNMSFNDQLNWGAPIDVSYNLNATRLIERSTQFTSPSGTVDYEE